MLHQVTGLGQRLDTAVVPSSEGPASYGGCRALLLRVDIDFYRILYGFFLISLRFIYGFFMVSLWFLYGFFLDSTIHWGPFCVGKSPRYIMGSARALKRDPYGPAF